MGLVVGVQMEIIETTSGQPLVRVQNVETVQLNGPPSPMHGELLASTLERLAEDVKERANEQARQLAQQT